MPQKHSLSHISIIMDGNRRWAKNRSLSALEGYHQGYQKMKKVTKWCINQGIDILAVYAFSSENWNRKKSEVSYLMDLFRDAFKKDFDEVHKLGVQVKVIGQKERLASDIQKMIADIEAKTKNNKKLLFQIAISYGGRPDIV